MAEYIDREALFAEFDRLGLGEHSFVEKVFSDGVHTIIAGLPAADVAEVVRGKWKVYHYATGEIDLVCPLCCALNAHADLREFDLRDWHYCRRCGARLEGIV